MQKPNDPPLRVLQVCFLVSCGVPQGGESLAPGTAHPLEGLLPAAKSDRNSGQEGLEGFRTGPLAPTGRGRLGHPTGADGAYHLPHGGSERPWPPPHNSFRPPGSTLPSRRPWCGDQGHGAAPLQVVGGGVWGEERRLPTPCRPNRPKVDWRPLPGVFKPLRWDALGTWKRGEAGEVGVERPTATAAHRPPCSARSASAGTRASRHYRPERGASRAPADRHTAPHHVPETGQIEPPGARTSLLFSPTPGALPAPAFRPPFSPSRAEERL